MTWFVALLVLLFSSDAFALGRTCVFTNASTGGAVICNDSNAPCQDESATADCTAGGGTRTDPNDFLQFGDGEHEEQNLEFNSSDGGTFTITFDGQTTDPITHPGIGSDGNTNGLAQAVREGLEALSNVGAGNVVVDGTTINEVNVLFVKDLGCANQAEMTIADIDLGGTPGTPTVTTTTGGSAGSGTVRVIINNDLTQGANPAAGIVEKCNASINFTSGLNNDLIVGPAGLIREGMQQTVTGSAWPTSRGGVVPLDPNDSTPTRSLTDHMPDLVWTVAEVNPCVDGDCSTDPNKIALDFLVGQPTFADDEPGTMHLEASMDLINADANGYADWVFFLGDTTCPVSGMAFPITAVTSDPNDPSIVIDTTGTSLEGEAHFPDRIRNWAATTTSAALEQGDRTISLTDATIVQADNEYQGHWLWLNNETKPYLIYKTDHDAGGDTVSIINRNGVRTDYASGVEALISTTAVQPGCQFWVADPVMIETSDPNFQAPINMNGNTIDMAFTVFRKTGPVRFWGTRFNYDADALATDGNPTSVGPMIVRDGQYGTNAHAMRFTRTFGDIDWIFHSEADSSPRSAPHSFFVRDGTFNFGSVVQMFGFDDTLLPHPDTGDTRITIQSIRALHHELSGTDDSQNVIDAQCPPTDGCGPIGDDPDETDHYITVIEMENIRGADNGELCGGGHDTVLSAFSVAGADSFCEVSKNVYSIATDNSSPSTQARNSWYEEIETSGFAIWADPNGVLAAAGTPIDVRQVVVDHGVSTSTSTNRALIGASNWGGEDATFRDIIVINGHFTSITQQGTHRMFMTGNGIAGTCSTAEPCLTLENATFVFPDLQDANMSAVLQSNQAATGTGVQMNGIAIADMANTDIANGVSTWGHSWSWGDDGICVYNSGAGWSTDPNTDNGDTATIHIPPAFENPNLRNFSLVPGTPWDTLNCGAQKKAGVCTRQKWHTRIGVDPTQACSSQTLSGGGGGGGNRGPRSTP